MSYTKLSVLRILLLIVSAQNFRRNLNNRDSEILQKQNNQFTELGKQNMRAIFVYSPESPEQIIQILPPTYFQLHSESIFTEL